MKKALVYGSNGALGRCLVSGFKKQSWIVTEVDIDKEQTYSQIEQNLRNSIKDTKFNAIINVAGGWAPGKVTDPDFYQTLDKMLSSSLSTSIISTRIAATNLEENGLLVLTGADGAIKPAPDMLAYGIAKNSVHYLVKSCGSANSGLEGKKVVGILPAMIDTPMNRKFLVGNEDTSTWTSLHHITGKFIDLIIHYLGTYVR